MSRIKGRDTGPELTIATGLDDRELDYETHCRDLPGRPDFVFRREGVAVFVDGDFWHGWRFPQWKDKLSGHWARKIQGNRNRDQRNHRKLRRRGWKVIRIWEHQVKRDPAACIDRIVDALEERRYKPKTSEPEGS